MDSNTPTQHAKAAQHTAIAWALVLVLAAVFSTQAQATSSYTDDLGSGQVVRLTNVSAPGVDTAILNAASSAAIVWPSTEPLRVTICVNVSTVFNLMLTPSGEAEIECQLNSSALTAGVEYTFDYFGLVAGDSIEFEIETDSAIRKLSVGRLKKD